MKKYLSPIFLFSFCIVSVNSHGETLVEQINILKTFRSSFITIEGKKFQILKGIVNVKLDRSTKHSAHIDLPVWIYKSSNATPKDPVFWLAGGPGVSNLKQKPSKKILLNHDYILIGYRGVDGSIKLNSKKIQKAAKGLNNSLLSDESLNNIKKNIETYFLELSAEKTDLNNFTIIDVIDDFEDIRKQLCYDKINLFSVSYGTRVALLYNYRYPKSIHKSIMVGMNPPGHFIWLPEKTEQIIQSYDLIYKNLPNSDKISIEESIQKALSNMPERWSCFKLDAGKIKATTFILLYRKQTAVMAFDAYKIAAKNNDYSGLYLMQLAYDYLVPRMFSWGDLYNKGASIDFNEKIDYKKILYTDKNKIGAPISLLFWCVVPNWPANKIENNYKKVNNSSADILMIGGNLDISTPPEYATQDLLPHMPNARQVVLKNMAHVDDLMYLQKNAFDNLVIKYLDNGEIDTSLFVEEHVDFNVSVGFSGLAKSLYVIVGIMSLFK